MVDYKMNLNKRHIDEIYKNQGDIQQIAKPLFDVTGLGYFTFGIYDKKQNGFYILTNNAAFYEHRLQKPYPIVGSHFSSGLYLWHEFLPEDMLSLAKEFNIDQAINFINEDKAFVEVVTFGAEVDASSKLSFYMNNRLLLEKFVLYFKDQGQTLIEHAKKNLAHFETTANNETIHQASYDKINVTLAESILPIQKAYLKSQQRYVELSDQERRVLFLHLKGLTAAMIGDILSISPRTVESYMERIKIKLNAKKRNDLFTLAVEEGWLQINPW